ncbi:hypothetical protein D3C79_748460 [compost metagenome]
MVSTLPRPVVIDWPTPVTAPAVTMLMPPTLRLNTPSGACTVKLPPRVRAAGSLAEPWARLASFNDNSPPSTSSPWRLTGLSTAGSGGASSLLLIRPTSSSGNSGKPLKPAVGKPICGSTRPATSSRMTKVCPPPSAPGAPPVPGPAAVGSASWVGSAPAAMACWSFSTSVSCAWLGVVDSDVST